MVPKCPIWSPFFHKLSTIIPDKITNIGIYPESWTGGSEPAVPPVQFLSGSVSNDHFWLNLTWPSTPRRCLGYTIRISPIRSTSIHIRLGNLEKRKGKKKANGLHSNTPCPQAPPRCRSWGTLSGSSPGTASHIWKYGSRRERQGLVIVRQCCELCAPSTNFYFIF